MIKRSFMIKFQGEINGKCLEDYFKRMRKEKIILMIFASIMLVGMCIFIIGLIEMYELLFIPLVVVMVWFIYALMPLTKRERRKFINQNLPHTTIIDPEEETITIKNMGPVRQFSFDEINEIHDYEEYYLFISGDPATRCQKSLLVEGTIEEFEKLFEGKIIKK